jgi:ABC-type uncharacterized transport system permease subunit
VFIALADVICSDWEVTVVKEESSFFAILQGIVLTLQHIADSFLDFH